MCVGWGMGALQSITQDRAGGAPAKPTVLVDGEVGHFQFSEYVLLKQWHFSLQACVVFKIINKEK